LTPRVYRETDFSAALDGDAGWHAANDLLLENRGGFTPELLALETDGGMKQAAAAKSIVHNFIILQAFPRAGTVLSGSSVTGPALLTVRVLRYTHFPMSTHLLDVNWMGKPQSIASALVRSENFAALIDPGPGSTIETLRQKLADHGLRVADLCAILLTHIHLDHAGATGALVQENPALRVYVHRRGAPHMVDPTKLLTSAERLYGAEMGPLFGSFLAVPQANLEVLAGGESIAVGSRELRVLYTPGHASHHVTYFDPTERVAFVGDTTGICMEGNRYILPATPPPDISLELWYASLDAISNLHPRRLFLTHFGFTEEASRHLQTYRERLREWGELSADILERTKDPADAVRDFARAVGADAAQYLKPEELSHYVFNGALQLSWLGLARYHQKRQEGQA
jgi:glyoxylase-like metal-dependent hydrolase (beta-lactamase superfamily II)